MKRTRTNGRSRPSWDEVRQRLAAAGRAYEEAIAPPPERVAELLEARARVLARPVKAVATEPPLEIAVFVLGAETYAIETRHVHEIARAVDLTSVPGAPDFVAGVTTLRGEIVAVIDLRLLLGIEAKATGEAARVVVLGGTRIELGLFADATREVTTIAPSAILEPPETVRGVGRDYVRGVTRDAWIVLDGAAILADKRLYVEQGDES